MNFKRPEHMPYKQYRETEKTEERLTNYRLKYGVGYSHISNRYNTDREGNPVRTGVTYRKPNEDN